MSDDYKLSDYATAEQIEIALKYYDSAFPKALNYPWSGMTNEEYFNMINGIDGLGEGTDKVTNYEDRRGQ